MQELRRLLPGTVSAHVPHRVLPFGLPSIDSVLPESGLPGGLHELVPETEAAFPAAFGFMAALLARLAASPRPLIFIVPAYGRRRHGYLSGHGLNDLGLDPVRTILVETAHRKETLWAIAEALHSGAPQAVAGMIDRLDLKTSQKLNLAAGDAALPLFLIRPAQTLESSAAATRWRIGPRPAARDRFGLLARPRWHLGLERCRNGRPGEWVVEYDHVAHRFSLAAALADPAFSRRPGAPRLRAAG
jgi:protein ImuA